MNAKERERLIDADKLKAALLKANAHWLSLEPVVSVGDVIALIDELSGVDAVPVQNGGEDVNECCATCKKWLELVMFDYQHGGCKHHDMGHACLAFADEGRVVYMVGTDAEYNMCECYEPNRRANDD